MNNLPSVFPQAIIGAATNNLSSGFPQTILSAATNNLPSVFPQAIIGAATNNLSSGFPQTILSAATNPSQITDLSQDEKFISGIKDNIHLSTELLKKDISNFEAKSKENLIKIHKSMNSIIEDLTNEINKIDEMKLYELNSNIRDNLNKLNNNLKRLNDMCNDISK